jgi:hypothetical protein
MAPNFSLFLRFPFELAIQTSAWTLWQSSVLKDFCTSSAYNLWFGCRLQLGLPFVVGLAHWISIFDLSCKRRPKVQNGFDDSAKSRSRSVLNTAQRWEAKNQTQTTSTDYTSLPILETQCNGNWLVYRSPYSCLVNIHQEQEQAPTESRW